MFSLSLWWKDATTKLCLLYCGFQTLVQLLGIFRIFTNLNNPLIPESMFYFASFAHFSLITFWLIGAYLFFRFLKNQVILKNKFWLIPLLLLGMIVGHSVLLFLTFQFNPFG
jgi:hypothetical protein